MSAIRLGAATNVRDFQNLLNALAIYKDHALDPAALQDEFGRFRVWSGNLGALQKGHSSLDYRLRDAPLLSGEVLKLLEELQSNLHAGMWSFPYPEGWVSSTLINGKDWNAQMRHFRSI